MGRLKTRYVVQGVNFEGQIVWRETTHKPRAVMWYRQLAFGWVAYDGQLIECNASDEQAALLAKRLASHPVRHKD